jgi:flagellar biosynthesis/type III secretory pathway protein FliH
MFRKYILMLEELSENRNLKEAVKKGEEMLTEINYEKLPSFELGFERGIQQGIQKGEEKGKQEGIVLGIKGIYQYEKNPTKIASILNIDKNFVLNVINNIKEK